MIIKILQAENSIENVDKSVISALYNAHINGDISLEVDNNNQKVGLVGSITAPAGYAILVSTLNSAYPKFHVSVTNEYILFKDPNIELILINAGLGDGTGITTLSAATAILTSSMFKNNTNIKWFPEFSYFTLANTNPPSSLFEGCSNLAEIDFSNVLKIDNKEFNGCSSLTGDLSLPNLSEFSGDGAFRGCTGITKILNLGNITSLPLLAFRECTGITEVTIPSTCITLLNWGVFSNCSNLTKVIGLENLTKIIGSYLFSGCDLDLTTLPSTWNIIQIGPDAFNSSKIHGEINCPKISLLGDNAFWGCGNITKLKCLGKLTQIPGGLISSYNVNNSLFTEAYIPFECTSIGGQAFRACENMTTIKLYTLSVDDWVEGLTPTYTNISKVTTFGNECFRGCNSLSLINTDITNATSIGSLAFSNCYGLSGALSLSNLASLGSSAFLNCVGITSIDFTGSTFNQLNSSIFNGCTNLTTVTLPSGCTIIGDGAFSGCTNLTTIPNASTITIIGNNAFLSCPAITGNISLPNLISLGDSAFKYTSISSIDFTGSTFTKAGTNLFRESNTLSTIIFPTTVTTLGETWYPSTTTLTIEGLDNVSSHSTNNWLLSNKVIKNPIKTSFTGDGSIVIAYNTGISNIHSLYCSVQLNTIVGWRNSSNFTFNTEFTYTSQRGTRITIGLLYYRDLTSFGEATFIGCSVQNLVINNITPPTLTLSTNSSYIKTSAHQEWGSALFPTGSNTSYPNIGTLWVPDSAVATYQADPLYSSLTIKGINTKTNGTDYDLPRYATYADWKTAEAAAVAQGGNAPLGLIEAWM